MRLSSARQHADSSEQQYRARECHLRGCMSPFVPSHGDSLREDRVLQCEQKRICTLSSTSDRSLTECGDSGNFFSRDVNEFSVSGQIRAQFKDTVQPPLR